MLRRHRSRIAVATIWWAIIVGTGAALLLARAGGAEAPSFDRRYDLTHAEVDVDVERSGVLAVGERLGFRYHGYFSGAYRDILVKDGEQVDAVHVGEGTTAFRPGAPTELGSLGPNQSFGVLNMADRTRVVWHYVAFDDQRTWDVSYRFRGVTNIYDDVAALNLQVWGDQWPRPLGRLTATITLPPGTPAQLEEVRAWPHLGYVDGSLRVDGRTVTLRTGRIPPQRFVEVRVIFPRAMLAGSGTPSLAAPVGHTSWGGPIAPAVQRRGGDGREQIVAEEARIAAVQQRRQQRLHAFSEHPARVVTALLLASLLPAFAFALFVWFVAGRDLRPAGVPEFEREPPDELAPAIAAIVTEQGTAAPDTALVATIFDLVRRGYFRVLPATSGRHGEVVDISIQPAGDARPTEPVAAWEQPLLDLLDEATGGEPVALGRLAAHIDAKKSRALAARGRAIEFQSAVAAEAGGQGWTGASGLSLLVLPFIACFAVAIFAMVRAADDDAMPLQALYLWPGLAVAALGNAVVLAAAMSARALWIRRAPKMRERAARWDSFRRYLAEYAHLGDDQPASLALWEKILVYGIAFGCADRVIATVRPPIGVAPAAAAATTGGLVLLHDTSGLDLDTFGGELDSVGAKYVTTSSSSSGGSSSWGSSSSWGGGSFGGGSGGGGGGAW